MSEEGFETMYTFVQIVISSAGSWFFLNELGTDKFIQVILMAILVIGVVAKKLDDN